MATAYVDLMLFHDKLRNSNTYTALLTVLSSSDIVAP
jgi:hypothetical protein